jgi:branched-chain amino acid transport system ATP-binding protein
LVSKIFETVTHFRDVAGLTVFVIEHRLDVVKEFTDWIYMMYRGRLYLSGTPSQVLSDRRLMSVYLAEESIVDEA